MGGEVAVAVLAAGRGSRLDADVPKPLVELGGRPLVAYALDAAVGSGLDPVLLVTGYRGDEVAAAAPAGVTVVRSPEWQSGIAWSLRAALGVLEGRASTAVCVGLADQPGVGPDSYRRLAAAHEAGAELAVATYGGRRGNPVLLGRSLWPEAQRLTGDAGARVLMTRHAVVEVDCSDTGTADDVDTLADLETARARSTDIGTTDIGTTDTGNR